MTDKTISAQVGLFLMLSFCAHTYASSVDVPNNFASGDAIIAAEMNQNFNALEVAVDDNDSRLSAAEVAITAAQTTAGNAQGAANTAQSLAGVAQTTANNAQTSAADAVSAANAAQASAASAQTIISSNEARIAALEASGGSGGSKVVSIDCDAAAPFSAPIQTALDNGAEDITLSGTCAENIVVTTKNVTIQSNSSAVITAVDNTEPALLVRSAQQFFLSGVSVSGGSQALAAIDNASVSLAGVTLHNAVFNSAQPLSGAALYASTNAVVELNGNNTLAGGAGNTSALLLQTGAQVLWFGDNNIITKGSGASSAAITAANGSAILQSGEGVGNQINGNVNLTNNTQASFNSVAISSDGIMLSDASSLTLAPVSASAISLVANNIDVINHSALTLGSDSFSVLINPAVTLGQMSLANHSSFQGKAGTVVNMNMAINQLSTLLAEGNTSVAGSLSAKQFSSARFEDVLGLAVQGAVTCESALVVSVDVVNAETDLCVP